MELQPIRTEKEYEAALNEINTLFDSQPGTSDGNRLDILVTLVEAYEMKHYPIPVPNDPIEILQYYLESRGLTPKE